MTWSRGDHTVQSAYSQLLVSRVDSERCVPQIAALPPILSSETIRKPTGSSNINWANVIQTMQSVVTSAAASKSSSAFPMVADQAYSTLVTQSCKPPSDATLVNLNDILLVGEAVALNSTSRDNILTAFDFCLSYQGNRITQTQASEDGDSEPQAVYSVSLAVLKHLLRLLYFWMMQNPFKTDEDLCQYFMNQGMASLTEDQKVVQDKLEGYFQVLLEGDNRFNVGNCEGSFLGGVAVGVSVRRNEGDLPTNFQLAMHLFKAVCGNYKPYTNVVARGITPFGLALISCERPMKFLLDSVLDDSIPNDSASKSTRCGYINLAVIDAPEEWIGARCLPEGSKGDIEVVVYVGETQRRDSVPAKILQSRMSQERSGNAVAVMRAATDSDTCDLPGGSQLVMIMMDKSRVKKVGFNALQEANSHVRDSMARPYTATGQTFPHPFCLPTIARPASLFLLPYWA